MSHIFFREGRSASGFLSIIVKLSLIQLFVTIIDKLNDFVSRNASFFFKKKNSYITNWNSNIMCGLTIKKKLPNKLDHRNFYEFGHQQEQIVLLSSLNC